LLWRGDRQTVTERQAVRKAVRKAIRQAGRQGGMQAGGQGETQVDRLTVVQKGKKYTNM
jgi:hypothetical protein